MEGLRFEGFKAWRGYGLEGLGLGGFRVWRAKGLEGLEDLRFGGFTV